jgi:hypothetical protein
VLWWCGGGEDEVVVVLVSSVLFHSPFLSPPHPLSPTSVTLTVKLSLLWWSVVATVSVLAHTVSTYVMQLQPESLLAGWVGQRVGGYGWGRATSLRLSFRTVVPLIPPPSCPPFFSFSPFLVFSAFSSSVGILHNTPAVPTPTYSSFLFSLPPLAHIWEHGLLGSTLPASWVAPVQLGGCVACVVLGGLFFVVGKLGTPAVSGCVSHPHFVQHDMVLLEGHVAKKVAAAAAAPAAGGANGEEGAGARVSLHSGGDGRRRVVRDSGVFAEGKDD